jgi:PAS domain S-box-containing protein
LWRDGFVYRSEHDIYDAGRPLGKVALERNLTALTTFLSEAQKSSATTDAVLCGRAASSLFCFPSRFYADPTWHELHDEAGKPRWPVVRALDGESGSVRVKADARGVPVIAAFVPLPRERLGLVQKLETQELYAPLRERLPVIVGVALLMIVACTVLLRRRVEPLIEQVLVERARMQSVIDGANDAFIAIDSSGVVTHWNSRAEQMLGRAASHAVGTLLVECLPGIDPRLARAARGGEGWNEARRAEIVTTSASGEHIPLEISVSPIADVNGDAAASIFARDLTAQKAAERELARTQRELLQAQKLDAIGKLTGGVAHDFNNLLQVIGANTALLSREGGLNANGQRLLAACARSVERGSRLASQLLAFARRQPLQPVPLDVNQQVQGMDDLLRRSLGERISVETVLAGGLWRTLADPHGLENVLLNLAINARDAMPDGGRLTVETANVELDDAYTRTVDDLQPGQYVMVAVSDTGTGMPPDVAARAFDPFFTTKPEGKGTGLGLSMAYGFAKQTGGHIRIYSELGSGTTIKLYLPRTLAPATAAQPGNAAPVRGGTETILVVEDDVSVRSCAVDMLRALGYETLEAANAVEALDVVRSARRLHLLFTDVVMPGPVRAPELAREARRLRPDLEVLYTSGYTHNAIVHGGRLDPGVELLSKPYSQDELARRVRKLLDGRGRAQAVPADPGSPAASRPLRVLFVEDEADLRETTHQLLALMGVVVTSVASAEEAMRTLQNNAVDLVITDLSLPGRTGYELAAWIKRNVPAVRVAFASGYGHTVQAPPACPFSPSRTPPRTSRDCSCPSRRREFANSPEPRWGRPSAGARKPASPSATNLRQSFAMPNHELKVLVADDNEDALLTLADVLELLGCRVTVARNGKEAVEAARRVRPDVAILDIGMPVMDGLAAAAELRRATPGTRLVACTGWGAAADRQRSEAAGFDLHLTKPVDLVVLQRVLEDCALVLQDAPDQRQDSRVEVGALVRADGDAVMLVNAVEDGWAYCVWFDERLEVRHASFRLHALRNVGQCRRQAHGRDFDESVAMLLVGRSAAGAQRH